MPDLAQRTLRAVAVLGSSGFVGSAVATELRRQGVEVRPVEAPRLRWPPDQPYHLHALPARMHPEIVDGLARKLEGTRAVVNAAGLPDGTAPAGPALYGANALLPTLVARACVLAGIGRYVHLSSAAVQGATPLDETSRTQPFSPYSHAKTLGERLLRTEPPAGQVLFRCTWVHDVGHPHTRSLIRLARSPFSCVAGDGSAPTPQVLVSDVAASMVHLALVPGPVPPIVLQPHNGMTTGLLLRLLGDREPRHVPCGLAHGVVRTLRGYGRLGDRARARARHVDMLLFGRRQVRGWLVDQGMTPAVLPEAWHRLTYVDPMADRTGR